MSKKMYFTIDNGDTPVTAELSGILTMLKSEAEDATNHHDDIELYQWTISPILLTEEEYKNLPEAY